MKALCFLLSVFLVLTHFTLGGDKDHAPRAEGAPATTDSFEKITEEFLAQLANANAILASAADQATSDAAKTKLQGVTAEIKKLTERSKKLGPKDDATQTALRTKFEEKVSGAFEQLSREHDRLKSDAALTGAREGLDELARAAVELNGI